MELKDLLGTTPETLATMQRDALQDFVLNRLETIIKLLKRRDYEAVERMLSSSPSGDEMGADNDYIDFADVGAGIEDIGDVVEKLKRLHQQATASASGPKTRGV